LPPHTISFAEKKKKRFYLTNILRNMVDTSDNILKVILLVG